jgi:hypothetical protein
MSLSKAAAGGAVTPTLLVFPRRCGSAYDRAVTAYANERRVAAGKPLRGGPFEPESGLREPQ